MLPTGSAAHLSARQDNVEHERVAVHGQRRLVRLEDLCSPSVWTINVLEADQSVPSTSDSVMMPLYLQLDERPAELGDDLGDLEHDAVGADAAL